MRLCYDARLLSCRFLCNSAELDFVREGCAYVVTVFAVLPWGKIEKLAVAAGSTNEHFEFLSVKYTIIQPTRVLTNDVGCVMIYIPQ